MIQMKLYLSTHLHLKREFAQIFGIWLTEICTSIG
jgi:hypothetical protein